MSGTLFGVGMLFIVVFHNIYVLEDDWLRIGGPDPFLVIEIPEDRKLSRGVIIAYEMEGYPETFKSQVFFSTDLHDFDKKFRYDFTLEGKKHNKIFIPLDMYGNEWFERFRWDFDDCDECKIRIKEFKYVEKNDMENYTNNIPQGYRHLKFIYNGELDDQGEKYTIQDFHIDGFEHLSEKGNVLKVKNRSPFIVSPVIDFSLIQAGGVYLKLGVPKTQDRTIYFKLGWRTYKYGYRTKARLRVEDVVSDKLEIFVPFTDLSSEKVVRQFQIMFEPEVGDIWSFDEIKIVSKKELAQYLKFMPNGYVDFPGEPEDGLQIALKGFQKFFSDAGFAVFFVFVNLGLVIILLWITIKKRERI